MTEYEKLRDDVANLLYNEIDASLDIAESVMAVILAALQTPTPEIIHAAAGDNKNGMKLVAKGFWQAMLNASPLVKP